MPQARTAWPQGRAKRPGGRWDRPELQGRQIARFTISPLVVFHGKETRMIYWPRQAEEFTMVIPNASGYTPAADDPALWMEVRNNVGLQEFPGVLDGAAVTPMYISMTFDHGMLPDEMPDGEYDYALRLGEDGPVISCGLLIVGDYQPADCIQYDKPTTYEQYQPE